jgi:cob(I)alamin adenosyltransferase
MNKVGLTQIYSGDGKGKTSAAVGQAVRAKAAGFEVVFIYFNKIPPENGGENSVLERIGIETLFFASSHPDFCHQTTEEGMIKETAKGIMHVNSLFADNRYDMMVLDEILISVRDGFLDEQELIEIIRKKPAKLELVLTGRSMTDAVISEVDLVSEIKNVKHPFDMGRKWRKGIEK